MIEHDENRTVDIQKKKKKNQANWRNVDIITVYVVLSLLCPLPLKFYNTTFCNNIHDISVRKVTKWAWQHSICMLLNVLPNQ